MWLQSSALFVQLDDAGPHRARGRPLDVLLVIGMSTIEKKLP